MDSNELRDQKHIAAIKESMKNGVISPAEVDERLTAVIEKETAKPDTDINADLVCASQELLWVLHAQETIHIESHRQKQFAALKRHMNNGTTAFPMRRQFVRIAVVAAAILILFVVGDSVLRRQWLVSQQSDDEQQLLLQGQAIDPKLVDSGNAENDELVKELRTSDLHALSEFLGFTPPLPTYIPVGWELHSYHAAIAPNETLVTAAFLNEGIPKALVYEVTRYSDASLVRVQIEQNRNGDHVVLKKGIEVYVTENIDNTVCVWVSGMDFYILSAPISLDTMKEILESIH